MNLHGTLLRREELTRGDLESMCGLLDRHFHEVRRDVFERDLAGKDHAILLHDANGALRGFTTFAVVVAEVDGAPLRVVYSGDTIVDREAWGSFALAQSWIDSIRRLRAEHAGERWVWLLICSGVRTYRFLPVFFRRFYPHCDETTPAPAQRLIDVLAAARYGRQFDPSTGIVRLADPQPLREGLDDPARDATDPHARWFRERNPGHAAGDELVCITDIDDDNLTRAGMRMARLGERAVRRRTPVGVDSRVSA